MARLYRLLDTKPQLERLIPCPRDPPSVRRQHAEGWSPSLHLPPRRGGFCVQPRSGHPNSVRFICVINIYNDTSLPAAVTRRPTYWRQSPLARIRFVTRGPKRFIVHIAPLVATPAFAGVESLSLASQTAAASANTGAAKDVRATTKMRKAGKVAGPGLVIGLAAAGLGIAAAAGAFDSSDSN